MFLCLFQLAAVWTLLTACLGFTDYEITRELQWMESPNVMPENWLHNSKWGFVTGSFSNGTIHYLVPDETDSTRYTTKVLWTHPDLTGRISVGIAIRNDILYICHNNLTSFLLFYQQGKTYVDSSFPAGLMMVNISGNDTSKFTLLNNFNLGNIGSYNPTLNTSKWNVRMANDLALDSNNNVYISCSCSGVVYKVPYDATQDSDISIFAYKNEWASAGQLGPNGIDTNYFDSNNEFIMITIYYTGTLWKIPIASDGSAANDNVIQVTYDNADAIALGLDGARFHKANTTDIVYYYVCGNAASLLYRFKANTTNNAWDTVTLDSVVSTRYSNPTSVAFDSSDKSDHVYVINPYLLQVENEYPIQKFVFSTSSSGGGNNNNNNGNGTNNGNDNGNSTNSGSNSSKKSSDDNETLVIVGFVLAGVFLIGMLVFAGLYCKIKNDSPSPDYRGF